MVRVNQQSANYPIAGEAVYTCSHAGPAAALAPTSELPSTRPGLSSPEPVPAPFHLSHHLLRQRSPAALSQQPQGPTVLLHSDDFLSFTALIPNQYICLLLTVCLVH